MDPTERSYSDDDYVTTYSLLPMHYILHNRQTKYIGGKLSDFHFPRFLDRKEVGSIWLPKDTTSSIRSTMLSAMDILAHSPSVIVGIHERFLETVCILEILYGHVHSFHWNKEMHAHYKNLTYKPLKQKGRTDYYRNSTVFKNWQQRNGADIELYEYSKALFDVQFTEALLLLKKLNASGQYIRAPHCHSFLLN